MARIFWTGAITYVLVRGRRAETPVLGAARTGWALKPSSLHSDAAGRRRAVPLTAAWKREGATCPSQQFTQTSQERRDFTLLHTEDKLGALQHHEVTTRSASTTAIAASGVSSSPH